MQANSSTSFFLLLQNETSGCFTGQSKASWLVLPEMTHPTVGLVICLEQGWEAPVIKLIHQWKRFCLAQTAAAALFPRVTGIRCAP